MGKIGSPDGVLLLVAASSRYDEALQWAREHAEREFGDTCFISPAFDFSETAYYAATMGPDLKKQFIAFERLVDPSTLSDVKRTTNGWEAEYAGLGQHAESRPLNLDPGYITPAKLVLASTKDHAHRIYLGGGIYAEVTLSYRGGRWQLQEWTYPDYRRDDYQQFFTKCREHILSRHPRSSSPV